MRRTRKPDAERTDDDVVVTFSDAAISPDDATAREARRQLALTWLREGGWNLGGAPYPSRDELHDRTR